MLSCTFIFGYVGRGGKAMVYWVGGEGVVLVHTESIFVKDWRGAQKFRVEAWLKYTRTKFEL